MSKSKAPSQRQLRVGELVRHALTEVLMRENFSDPVLDNSLISVSEVRMSPDLKIATCFIAPLGGGRENFSNSVDSPSATSSSANGQVICKALARHAGFIRARATPHLKQMKYMPDFRFLEDTSFDNFSRIDELLRSEAVQQDLIPKE